MRDEDDDDELEPGAAAQVRGSSALIEAARDRLGISGLKGRKRLFEIHRNLEERHGPQGETRSEVLTKRTESIPLEKICDDPNFQNLRLNPTDQQMQLLMESMQHEGLKVPIEVIPNGEIYHVRCGFRRTKAARLLKWKTIPSIVLPEDTPTIDEYWTNIIENTARENLSTYETAHAAKTMRDKFRVSPSEFARRAGLTESYVYRLLKCIDKLHPDIIAEWKDRAPIPLGVYEQWTNLNRDEAVTHMMRFRGRHPQVVGEWQPSPKIVQEYQTKVVKMVSSVGLARMQRLRMAAEQYRAVDERTRRLCMQIIDFCTGARNDVPGMYDGKTKFNQRRSRRRDEFEEMFGTSDASVPEVVAMMVKVGIVAPEMADELIKMLAGNEKKTK